MPRLTIFYSAIVTIQPKGQIANNQNYLPRVILFHFRTDIVVNAEKTSFSVVSDNEDPCATQMKTGTKHI